MMSYLEQLEQTVPRDRWVTARRWMADEPLQFFSELRRHRPVLVLPEVTLVTRFVDCTEVLRRHDLYSVALYRAKQGDYWMAQDDTAEHWREKSIMRAILDREDVPQIRSSVSESARRVLSDAGGSLEAVSGLTRAIPVALVQEHFGYTDSDPDLLVKWSYWNQLDAFWNQPFDAAIAEDPSGIVAKREAANAEMREYLIELVGRRAQELKAGGGGDDPVSRLLRLSFSGAVKFDVSRVVLNVGGLLIGAVETTSHAVVNALDYILKDPDRLTAARAAARSEDKSALNGHIFEAMRFRPAFPYFFRVTEQDVVLARATEHETEIPRGTPVLAVTHAAMHDDEAYPHPGEFDPNRSQSNAFHFGMGLHECLGRVIGELMIIEIARQALLLEDLEVGPVERLGGPVPEAWSWSWR